MVADEASRRENDGESGPPAADRPRAYRAAIIAVALQWSLRLIGLISVLILARVLSPADFGIAGLAMTAVAFVEIFSFIGLRQALLRLDKPEREHLDTAWTIQLLLFLVLGVLLVGIAPWAADFYGRPVLASVLMVLSLRFVFLGLINIGIVEFDRNLEFGRDLLMRMSSRLLAFCVTVALALLLRSYWALIIGMIAQSLFLTIASYAAHGYRPRFDLSRRRELLGVSLWMFIGLAAQIMQNQIERIAVGRTSSTEDVGLYSVAKDLSSIFTHEIATALNRVTFVTTAREPGALGAMPDRLGLMLGAYTMIVAPLGLGLAAVADSAVQLLLGSQWGFAAPLLKLVAPAAAMYAVYKLIASSLQASGRVRTVAFATGGGAVFTAVLIAVTATYFGDPASIAASALLANLVILVFGICLIAHIARTSTTMLTAHVIRPFTAATAMCAVVSYVPIQTGIALGDLLLKVGLGALVYLAGLGALWFVAGLPRGAESETMLLIRSAGGKLSRDGNQTSAR